MFEQGSGQDALAPSLQNIALGTETSTAVPEAENYVRRGVIQAGKQVLQPVKLMKHRPWKPTPILAWIVHYRPIRPR